MSYQQHPHPHYYPQQPMHPSHVPPQPGPPPLPVTHQGPSQQHPPPQHQQHMMPTGPPQQSHHHQPGGGYYQHPGYGHPPPQQAMPPPPGPYMQYNHYYSHQTPPQPMHGPPVPHPHGPPSQQPTLPNHASPQHQQHMLPQGPPPPQQTHHHPGYAYHHPSMQPSYHQPPHPHPQQTMPHGSPYGQYNHYYQPPIAPMQPMQPMQHGPPIPHPHGPPNQPPPPHHQSQIMPPGPQQPHQSHHYYPHPPLPHPAYHQSIQHQQQPPPPQPPPHPQAQPHPNLTPQPIHSSLPPQSPHHPTSRAQTPQLGNQTPTKSMQHPSSTPASSPSITAKIEKKDMTFPKNSVEATKLATTKRRKYTSKDVTDVEVWRLLMCLKSGLLAESSWAIDVLSILLNDDSTSMYFSLSNMPGFLEAILDHLKCSLGEIFKDMAIKDTALDAELSKPVNYSHWQEGNGEDMSYIQVYTEPHNSMETIRRCICISTVLRNLSFTPGNEVEMSKHAGLLLILGKILMYKLEDEDKEVSTEPTPNEWLLNSLREDALVLISNLSSSMDLSQMTDRITFAILNSLLYWAVSDDAYALDPFPSPSMVSPQKLALEALAKLSIVEANVDLIFATPPWSRIEQLLAILTNKLQMNEDQPIREFSLVLLSNLVGADSGIARKVAQGDSISRLVSFLETSLNDPEKNTTTQDMLRRAALTLRSMSNIADCRTVFTPKHQQRLLNLVMSRNSAFDSEVNQAIASIIFDLSV